MTGLLFEEQALPAVSAPNRADIACFLGFVSRREGVGVPPLIRAWLSEQGWTRRHPVASNPPYARPDAEVEALLDLPVPIETWDTFDRLFAWERRPLDSRGQVAPAYLGAAVRSFFAQGGRMCYVVRVGDPWEYTASRTQRVRSIGSLIPGFPASLAVSPADRQSWRGVGHLFGLPDVSFLCLPDLADAVRVERVEALPPVELPPLPEQFVECSEEEPASPQDTTAHLLVAPRCDVAGYDLWAQALRCVADLLIRHRREVQLVAAVPIPYTPPMPTAAGARPEADLLEFFTRADGGPLAYRPAERLTGVASAFVQLVYPWVRTSGSGNLPEALESPDAVLIGILARNALTHGTYRSVAGLYLGDVYDVYPLLRRDQICRTWPDHPGERIASHSLLERVSTFGPTPDGWSVLSDTTTALDESYRPASVNRLMASVIRAARQFGEDVVFEASGERLWGRLWGRLYGLLLTLFQAGALRGATPNAAFSVRCDRSTMSQQDLDAGRIIVQIILNPAAPIEEIRVALALESGGQVSLTGI